MTDEQLMSYVDEQIHTTANDAQRRAAFRAIRDALPLRGKTPARIRILLGKHIKVLVRRGKPASAAQKATLSEQIWVCVHLRAALDGALTVPVPDKTTSRRCGRK